MESRLRFCSQSVSILVLVLGCVVCAGSSLAQQPADQGADSVGALGLVKAYVSAWNAHDMEAVANLFSENAEFINPLGNWTSGRAAIKAEHVGRHTTIFQSSTMTADTSQVRFISPDVAVLHFQWTLTGALNPDGTPSKPFHGLTTFLGKKDNGRWWIESGQVTFVGTPPGIATPGR